MRMMLLGEKGRDVKEREMDLKQQVKGKDRDGSSQKSKHSEIEKDTVDKGRDHLRERKKEKEKDRSKDADVKQDRSKDKEVREKERHRDRKKDIEKEKLRSKDHNQKEDLDKLEKGKLRDAEKGEQEVQKLHGKGREKEREREHEKDRSHTREDRDDKRAVSELKPQAAPVASSELEDKVSRMRRERMRGAGEKKTKAQALSLAEDEGQDDIASWVGKSRQLAEKRKAEERAKAARMAKMLAEQDEGAEEDEDDWLSDKSKYNSKDLAGMKVRHGLDKVMEGGAVVLTLKDSNILDGGDINEAVDELENVEIAEQQARERAYKESKKTGHKYEDKFENDMDMKPRSILAKYDDAIPEDGVVLDDSGGVDQESRSRLEEVRKRLHGLNGTADTLAGSLAGPASDYFTQEEMAKFKKPKKKKKLRKKEAALDYDALEAEAKAAGLGGAENVAGRGDRGSRRAVKEEEEKVREAEGRRAAYENAYHKAIDKSQVLRESAEAGAEETGEGARGDETAAERTGVKEGQAMEVEKEEEEEEEEGEVKVKEEAEGNEEGMEMGVEEDDELQRSLQRARQAALKKQAESAMAAGPQALVTRLAALRREVKQEPREGKDEEEEEGKKLVFTDTEEFCRSLQLDEALTRRTAARDAFGEEDEEGHTAMEEDEQPAEAPAVRATEAGSGGGGWTQVKGDGKEGEGGLGGKGEGREGEDEEEEEEEEPTAEAPVGKGLGAALGLLKDRGALTTEPEWGGRNMDKKKSKLVGILDSVAPPGQKEIRIDRRDEFGREMTPKEAFRWLSWKFHGKGPGKMKQDKRIRQYEEELKLKKMNAGDTPLMSLEKMRETQEKLSAPYIVLSGQIKPGQTSDPRSTFGVEKEHVGSLTPMLGDRKEPGSLTPMLGDQKVEHFLGIKRRGEGSMGPPPPKKPKQ